MLITALKKLKSFGFDPKNILDIGANKGKWSIEVSKKVFPNAKYILIEAIDYEELKKISAKNHNISFINLLLDDVEHNVTWYQKKNTGDSIYKENTSYFKDCEEIVKKTTTLDKNFSNNLIDYYIASIIINKKIYYDEIKKWSKSFPEKIKNYENYF